MQTQSKTKRVRDLPQSFEALQTLVEAQIKQERESRVSISAARDYVIRYVDGDDEAINVSDDEDLLTAYDVAEKELKGSLRFTVSFKEPMVSRQSTLQ